METKPGMSGLRQISGRNDTGYGERVYLDGWYAKNWTLWMDIVILFNTVGVVAGKTARASSYNPLMCSARPSGITAGVRG
ncbi:sugar transferase [uncultured Thiohalocapsa sp.]|uniref:sugar transferase n=1 Tax=uncultured Thiohalocapsa sp. TaxID=768990 RepID=UPI00345ABF21